MPLFIGGAIAAVGLGSSIAGDLTAASGQAATNQENMAIAQKQMDFQQQQQLQAENYDTQMSDTAVSRRMADLQSAGLNPMLAVGNPASSPMISGQSGASIPVSNPEASFANLGGQSSSALSGGVQAMNAMQSTAANVANTNADTAQKLAQLPYSGAQAASQVSNIDASTRQLQASADNMQQDWLFNRDTFGQKFDTLMNNAQFQRDLNGLTLQANQVNLQRAQLGMPQLQNEAAFANTWWGKYIAPIFNSGGGSGASSALGTAAQFIK